MELVPIIFGIEVAVGAAMTGCWFWLLKYQERLNEESKRLALQMSDVADRLDRHKGMLPIKIITERDGSTTIGPV